MTPRNQQTLKRLVATNFFLYAIDMAMATLGFLYGFGLSVQNWWALLGFMLLSRWVFHIATGTTRMLLERQGEMTVSQARAVAVRHFKLCFPAASFGASRDIGDWVVDAVMEASRSADTSMNRRPAMNLQRAREIAAQVWCEGTTCNIEMDDRLSEAFANVLMREVNA